eukprot:1154567-Pelagomonas_calceolata.AAC.2
MEAAVALAKSSTPPLCKHCQDEAADALLKYMNTHCTCSYGGADENDVDDEEAAAAGEQEEQATSFELPNFPHVPAAPFCPKYCMYMLHAAPVSAVIPHPSKTLVLRDDIHFVRDFLPPENNEFHGVAVWISAPAQ